MRDRLICIRAHTVDFSAIESSSLIWSIIDSEDWFSHSRSDESGVGGTTIFHDSATKLLSCGELSGSSLLCAASNRMLFAICTKGPSGMITTRRLRNNYKFPLHLVINSYLLPKSVWLRCSTQYPQRPQIPCRKPSYLCHRKRPLRWRKVWDGPRSVCSLFWRQNWAHIFGDDRVGTQFRSYSTRGTRNGKSCTRYWKDCIVGSILSHSARNSCWMDGQKQRRCRW